MAGSEQTRVPCWQGDPPTCRDSSSSERTSAYISTIKSLCCLKKLSTSAPVRTVPHIFNANLRPGPGSPMRILLLHATLALSGETK